MPSASSNRNVVIIDQYILTVHPVITSVVGDVDPTFGINVEEFVPNPPRPISPTALHALMRTMMIDDVLSSAFVLHHEFLR